MRFVLKIVLCMLLACSAESNTIKSIASMTDGIVDTSAPSNAFLVNYGGPVLANVEVFPIFYGSFWSTTTGKSVMAKTIAFYKAIVQSNHFDMLNQYNAGRGAFIGSYVEPSPSSSSSITDAQIKTYLTGLKTSGKIAPKVNSYYPIHYSAQYSITAADGSKSCVVFCAYHGSYVSSPNYIYYGVIPYNVGTNCASGCGSSSVPFNNYCSYISHELVEAVTDPRVSQATNYAPPLAWYDKNYGEIADICNAQQGSIVGSDGVTYTVQKEFNNLERDCVTLSALSNGGFENSLTGWTNSAGVPSVVAVASSCHSGARCLRLGSTSATNGDTSVSRTIAVPSGYSKLRFWYRSVCAGTVSVDWAMATLKDSASATTTTILGMTCSANGSWTQVTVSVTASHTYTLKLISHDNNVASTPTYTLFDDVSVGK